MGVKYGYEIDTNGRPVEIITEYIDDGLELICDVNNLTDCEEMEYETNTTPPAYKVPTDFLAKMMLRMKLTIIILMKKT